MQCNCGGVTVDKQQVENKLIVATWQVCSSCGRIGNLREVSKSDRK